MIKYALKCGSGHEFESWFQSASAFDSLKAGGFVECPSCGDSSVEKAMMAPRVTLTRAAEQPAPAAAPAPGAPTQTLASGPPSALERLKAEIEAKSEYVGDKFAAEARRIHDSDAPERPIHGQAKAEDAKALLEEGIPVLPLPFMPVQKTN